MESIDIPSRSQKRLLELSRQTLERFVRGAAGADGPVEDPHLLTSDYGAFVGLHRGKRLRGCVGTCFPTGPLYETVIDMTEAAASRDRRVAAIAPGELAHIRIDISVLGPLEPAADPLALPIGRRGIYVAGADRRGVLLPQVALEYGWDMETFLRQTCVKAGLAGDAWKRPETRVASFIALVIEEAR
ncbi:MAG TPA: AmmeMemoRadiSam system protein A [Candidatus Binatia bacterium]